MLNHSKLFRLVFILSLASFVCQASIYNDSQSGIAGTALKSTGCNKNSLNDFTFSSSSALTYTRSTFYVNNVEQNMVTYLDAKGNQRTYTLQTNATIVNTNIIGSLNYAFLFTFVDSSSNAILYLAIPFDLSSGVTGNYTFQTINLANTTDTTFSSLASFSTDPNSVLTSLSGLNLSSFNFLTTLNYNQFYSAMDSTGLNTLLVSKAFLQVSNVTGLTYTSTFSFTPDYKTADVLCWGQFSMGQFQTHMRQSVPMWFFLFAVMALWMYVLLTNENTSQVFQRSFQNNKWTSWSLYSLYYLAHEEFFSRMSRGANLLIVICWQAMVVSSIYSMQYASSGNGIIIWAAVIGWAASLPFPYVFGNIFLKKIYQLQSQRMLKKIEEHHQLADKKKREQYQRDAILIGQEVYSYNYWYYSTILILLAIFSILSVHTMQSIPSLTYFYRNWHWLISMGVIIGWDNLVFDPIVTACFGDKEWYQNRGYYYNAELGQQYRKAD